MIDIKDLRIGNFVNRESIPFMRIETGFDIDLADTYEPIPLTEAILEKCGFDNGNKELSNCDLWDKWWIGDFEISFEGDRFEYGNTRINHLHQLQNLYFALTGEELNYQP